MQVEDYTVDGHQFKSMMDRVIVDHQEMTIQVYDLKCTWNVENFYEEYYLYRRAYIQAYLYMRAAEWAFRGYDKYTVLEPIFLVCDSANYFRPLLYQVNSVNLFDAYNGFEHKGRKYPGVKALINELSWAHTNNIWNISLENLNNNGIAILK